MMARAYDHSQCIPGKLMCVECADLFARRGVRREIQIARELHPQSIMPGFCLGCGHAQHGALCDGKDFWAKPCGCRDFIARYGQRRGRRTEAER